MSIHDNQALLRLPKNLGQTDRFNRAAGNEIRKEPAGADARKLVWVAHQNQLRLLGQGQQQTVHQQHVHHGNLVHNQRVALKRLVLVAHENHLSRFRRDLRFQQAVDG